MCRSSRWQTIPSNMRIRAPVNVQALKFAMYSVIPDTHQGIILPPAKYSLAPLFTFMKYNPMPSMNKNSRQGPYNRRY